MRTLHRITGCATWALLAAIAVTSQAAEPSPGAPLPGLTSDEGSKVMAKSCLVTLSGKNVSVELSVHTDSTQPALLLEGPLFGGPAVGQGESSAYPDQHFPELEVRIDGARMTPEDRFEVFIGRRDITSAIRDAGMDPWAITRSPPVTPVRADSRVLKALESMHAVQRSGDDYLASWTARRMLRIPLVASANQRIELRYRARPALVELPADEALTGERETLYCVSAKQANAMLHAGSDSRPLHLAEYSIATGIDGHATPTVLLMKSADSGAAPGPRVFTFACGPRSTPLAVAGNLTSRPVQVDQAGNLHILELTRP